MMLTALTRVAVLAAIMSGGVSAVANAQTTSADPHHPNTTLAQAKSPTQSGETGGQGRAQPGQPGTMGQGMMGQGMMGGMMQPGMMGGMPMMHMRGHMVRIMFAIADVNGDGGLSFDEIATIQKRIFDQVDADKDGKVTSKEIQTFMQE